MVDFSELGLLKFKAMYVDVFDLGALLQGKAEYIHRFYHGGIYRAEADELYHQDFVIVGKAYEPKMFLIAVDLIFAQEDLLHDVVNILRVDDFYFLCIVELDVH